jgi:hypothetical protein
VVGTLHPAYRSIVRIAARFPAAPEAWALATAVWTGDELVIVGGCCATSTNATGYDPLADEWTPLPDLPFDCEPTHCSRYGPAPVWTGTTAIIWGGLEETATGDDGMNSSFLASGAALHLGL